MSIGDSAKSGTEFAAHIVMATVVLILVAAAAVGLGYFLHWIASVPVEVVPSFVHRILQVIEYALFVIDIVTYCLYVGVMTFSFCKALLKG